VHPVVYLSKSMVEATKARVAAISSATLFGWGVFTTVAIYNGQPFLWIEHWKRLAEDAYKLGIDYGGMDQEDVGEALRKLISVNRVRDGRARITLLAKGGRDIWNMRAPEARKTDLLIMTGEAEKIAADGVTLAVSPNRFNTFSSLSGIKSLNYLEHVLSSEEAHRRDFDEAVMLNERGEIVSATMANIFWVKDGTVHTPALSTGAIPGITRACVIELAAKHFIPVVEGVYEMPDLVEADEIFLTSAGLGVAIVTTFDFRRYSFPVGSVAATLRDTFLKLAHAL
jgi:branched-subunit amino acid aminotransferase/4-amino-4-deoxychorismate lyase